MTVSKSVLRGELYWVNLDPTVGAEIRKQRPAIIVSNNTANRYSPLVTILPISSQVKKAYPFEVFLAAGIGGLEHSSLIKANQIRTIDKQRLIGLPLGTITDATVLASINQSIRIHLSI